MKETWIRWSAILLVIAVLTTALAGCGEKLPPAAKAAVLDTFDEVDEPRIQAAAQAQPLAKDIRAGAEQVWCVNLTCRCWGPPYTFEDRSTCAASRLLRLIDGEWQVSLVVTEEDQSDWEARGCELILDHIALP